MMINFILIYYTRGRYLGMKRQHIEFFETQKELTNFMYKHKLTLNNSYIYELIK